MKRSINFSIFRRKEGPQRTHATEQANRRALCERLAERAITLKEGDLTPLADGSPPLDWKKVDGKITLLASAIEGLLQGRARVTAQQLKSLNPSPIGSETVDAIEYQVSLATVIPQVQDLMGLFAAEVSGQPEFETPFTVLAREDSARFGHTDRKKHNDETSDQAAGVHRPASSGAQLSQEIVTGKEEPQPPPVAMQELERQREQNNFTTNEKPVAAKERLAPESPKPNKQTRPGTVERDSRSDESKSEAGGAHVDHLRWPVADDPASQGAERLQEIFMTSEPLDSRRVASFVQEFPGVTGALILLKDGAVIGGQLPDSVNLDAALQVPEVLQNFTRFILQIEAGQKARSIIVTVTSATTISLVSSGKIVLFVSHQGRKLPPGLAQRLTETAEALNLIYGK